MSKLNSVITIITHLEGVVYFYVFFASLFKFLSTSSESRDKGKVTHIKRYFFVLISHNYFLSVSNVFVFINCLCLFIATNKTHSKKPNRIERIKDVTLQNLAGGKYIYVPPNFIHARKKCATTPF